VSLDTKSSVTTNDLDMDNIFCDEFSKTQQSDSLNSHFVLPVLGRELSDTLNYVKFSDKTVEDGLSRLNQHKPPGSDEIPAMFLKKFSSGLAPIIRYAFNDSVYASFPSVVQGVNSASPL